MSWSQPRGLGTTFFTADATFIQAKRSTSGFSLVEMLIAVVIIGLVSLIAFPRFQDTVAQSNLRNGRTKVISLFAKARAVAIESSRIATLRVAGDQVYVIAQPRRTPGVGQFDTVTPVENIHTQYGVRISPDADIRVAPTGLGMDAAILVLRNGSHMDTVSISRSGQVQK